MAATEPTVIVVDEARWLWRGQRWGHMVSTESYAELHDFAERVGKRRVGFQGDHYDVTSAERERALRLGAEAVSSREVVRSLRQTGLRRPGGLPKWATVLEARCLAGAVAETVSAAPFVRADLGEAVGRAAKVIASESGCLVRLPVNLAVRVAVLERAGEVALLLEWPRAGGCNTIGTGWDGRTIATRGAEIGGGPLNPLGGTAALRLGSELGIREVRAPSDQDTCWLELIAGGEAKANLQRSAGGNHIVHWAGGETESPQQRSEPATDAIAQ